MKFHWKPKQGMQSVLWDEAVKINGADPDFHRRDLWDAITSGDFPEWELGLQVFDDAFADSFEFDVLDPTKLIPEEVLPVAPGRSPRARPDGRQLLRRDRAGGVLHPEHRARRRLHQRPAAPGPQLLVPRHPDQAARRPELHPPADQRAEVPDGALPAGRPHGDDQPGRARQLRAELVHRRRARARARTPTVASRRSRPSEGGDKRRLRPRVFADHYSQAGLFFRSQTPVEQQHIVDAFTFELSKVERAEIRERMVANLRNVDDDLAQRVADGLGHGHRSRPAQSRRRLRTTRCPRRRRSASSPADPTRSPAASSACSSPTARPPRSSRR